eukprot:scaffold20818_cov112-Isochrysis_galbana.AAC.3
MARLRAARIRRGTRSLGAAASRTARRRRGSGRAPIRLRTKPGVLPRKRACAWAIPSAAMTDLHSWAAVSSPSPREAHASAAATSSPSASTLTACRSRA